MALSTLLLAAALGVQEPNYARADAQRGRRA